MAKKTETIVTLTDDLDGTKADRTVSFSFDGSAYELELSKKNATAFEKVLQPYIQAGRKVRAQGSRARAAAVTTRPTSRTDLAEVRSWAKQNGYGVFDRGRVAQSIQDAYDAAH